MEKLPPERNEFHIALTMIIGFAGAFLLQMGAAIVYPPDFSGEFPIYPERTVLILQLSGAFLLIGLTVIAMKAEEERQILAAAGFTAQAISFGISIMSLFEITDVASVEDYQSFYRITVSSNFLYFPSLLLIASYARFRRWIRIFGFVASIPLLISTILFLSGVRNYHLLENISNTGYFLVGVTWLLWAFNAYTNYMQESKRHSP